MYFYLRVVYFSRLVLLDVPVFPLLRGGDKIVFTHVDITSCTNVCILKLHMRVNTDARKSTVMLAFQSTFAYNR